MADIDSSESCYVSRWSAINNVPVIIKYFLPFVVFAEELDPGLGYVLPSSRTADDTLLGKTAILLGDDVTYYL